MPWFVLIVIAASCANWKNPRSSDTPTPSASRTTSRSSLFGAFVKSGHDDLGLDSTVAILDLRGLTKARAVFRPRVEPYVGFGAAAVLPVQGVASSSGVYYADQEGAIRLLKPSGEIKELATIPLLEPFRQELSFAVSPNDNEFLASRITFPKKPDNASLQHKFEPGPVTVDIFGWSRSKGLQLVRHETLGQETLMSGTNGLLVLVGWNVSGPIGLIDTTYAKQGPIISRWYGKAVHVSTAGAITASLCGDGFALSAISDGTIACQVGKRVNVLSAAGALLWSATWNPILNDPAANNIGSLSPDGTHICVTSAASGSESHLLGPRGYDKGLPQGFTCRGWVTPQTMIGTTQYKWVDDMPMGVVSLSDLSTVDELGISGTFVGAVASSE